MTESNTDVKFDYGRYILLVCVWQRAAYES